MESLAPQMLLEIASYCDYYTICNMRFVCIRWRHMLKQRMILARSIEAPKALLYYSRLFFTATKCNNECPYCIIPATMQNTSMWAKSMFYHCRFALLNVTKIKPTDNMTYRTIVTATPDIFRLCIKYKRECHKM
jgi:hypothetical protein